VPELPCRAPTRVDNRKPLIVVSGPPGSGKSTYARRLAQDFCLEYKTTGMIFREIARARGLTLEELSRLAEQGPEIDFQIDATTLELAAQGGYVLDSHLAGWVLAGIADVRIMVTAGLPERLRRIAGREGGDYGRVMDETLERERSQWKRFYEYYGYDTLRDPGFDLILNTGGLTVDEAYRVLRDFVAVRLAALGYRL